MRMELSDQTVNLESKLNSFDTAERYAALDKLLAASKAPPDRGPGNELFNMHSHSFFSYNANGYSPCGIIWEARKAGLYAAGLCDFDVLDGLEEFIRAGMRTGVRTAAHIETRAFFNEYSQVDINSPGEPGVTYVMGCGFARVPAPGTTEASNLAKLRAQANERNIALVGRINARLPEIALDYKGEVAPTSPGGCPTERHIIRAYRLKAEKVFNSRERLFEFWGSLMKKNANDVGKLYLNIPATEDAIRSLLAKSGGLGYERPDAASFPPLDEFIAWVRSCGAIPAITWLDGTSRGEEKSAEMFDIMTGKGAIALNIIPDRNHNIADPVQRGKKLAKLDEVVRLAEKLELPVNIGTEMNKDGQPLADDATTGALRPYHGTFLKGARIMVGHTLLSRFADFPYLGKASAAEFGSKLKEKNAFFEAVGSLPPLTLAMAEKLEYAGPEKALTAVRASASRGSWILAD